MAHSAKRPPSMGWSISTPTLQALVTPAVEPSWRVSVRERSFGFFRLILQPL